MAAQKGKKEKKKRINLLPQEEFAASTLGRILRWLLTSFRIIVIFVELIVVSAFLSRFWLDARITDLNDEIKQKESIIESTLPFEKDFRKAQIRLINFAALIGPENSVFPVLNTLSSYLPDDARLVSVSVSESGILVSANSISENSVAQYMAGLNNSGEFTKISLNQMSSATNGLGVDFVLNVEKEGVEGDNNGR